MKKVKNIKWEEVFACLIITALFLSLIIWNPMFSQDVYFIDAILIPTLFLPVSLIVSCAFIFMRSDIHLSAKLEEVWFPSYLVFLWFGSMVYRSQDGLIFNIILPERLLMYILIETFITILLSLSFIKVIKKTIMRTNKNKEL